MLEVITGREEAGAKAEGVGATLDELARLRAQRMIAAALRVEADEYVARYQDARDSAGHALVVRARPRSVVTGVGPVPVTAPRVHDRRVVESQRQKFNESDPAPVRPALAAGRECVVLPLLYLHGLSTPLGPVLPVTGVTGYVGEERDS